MSKKEKWDGRSRPSTEEYKENYNRIFSEKKESLPEEDEQYLKSLKDKL